MNIAEFEKRVFKTNRCWYWTGALNGRGYGNLRVSGKCRYAHRVSKELYHGPVPPELDVLHSCDTPHCVNPEHLTIGTHAENMADMVRKGRVVTHHGSEHKNAKLTEEQVRSIRIDARAQVAIAQDFGVSFGLISNIKARRVWRHVQ